MVWRLRPDAHARVAVSRNPAIARQNARAEVRVSLAVEEPGAEAHMKMTFPLGRILGIAILTGCFVLAAHGDDKAKAYQAARKRALDCRNLWIMMTTTLHER